MPSTARIVSHGYARGVPCPSVQREHTTGGPAGSCIARTRSSVSVTLVGAAVRGLELRGEHFSVALSASGRALLLVGVAGADRLEGAA